MKNKRVITIALLIFSIIVISACNLPITLDFNGEDTKDSSGNDSAQSTDAPSIFGGNNGSSQETEAVAVEEDRNPNPVGLQDGLGSLDSYKIALSLDMHNSTGQKYIISETVERSIIDEMVHSVTSAVTFDPENDDEESNETQEVFSVGTDSCTLSDGEYELEQSTEQEKEFRDIATGMVDFVPLIDNPVFVAEETINGIECNHFTFQVSGIGDKSGSVATVNQGDYWLAKDGQYIVKYHLVLEIRSAAEGTEGAEVTNLETTVDLTNVNVPVSVTIPAECYTTTSE